METVKTVLLVLLIIAAGYFAWIDQQRIERMDVLNKHDEIQMNAYEDFKIQLHDLEMKFIGRGKHIQQFQRDLKDLDNKLEETKQQILVKIDSLSVAFIDYQRINDNRIQSIQDDIEKIRSDLSSVERKLNRRISDLTTQIRLLEADVRTNTDDIKTLKEGTEEKDKKRR